MGLRGDSTEALAIGEGQSEQPESPLADHGPTSSACTNTTRLRRTAKFLARRDGWEQSIQRSRSGLAGLVGIATPLVSSTY
jgi:hypothetical protein